jgi:putative heme-binding domain-containing protein
LNAAGSPAILERDLRFRTLFGANALPFGDTISGKSTRCFRFLFWAAATAVVEALAMTFGALLAAVAGGRVPSSDLSADLIRQLRNHKSRDLDARIGKVWGSVRETTGDRAALIAKFKAMLTVKPVRAPEPSLGRAVFARTCQQCHTLFGIGGQVGPELTGSNRADLDYILANVLDPSALIGKDYQAHVVATTDGRVLTGLIRSETGDALTLQTANETLTIPRNEIEERRQSDASMMPDDLWGPLSEHEVRSLVAYLASPVQVPLPEGHGDSVPSRSTGNPAR